MLVISGHDRSARGACSQCGLPGSSPRPPCDRSNDCLNADRPTAAWICIGCLHLSAPSSAQQASQWRRDARRTAPQRTASGRTRIPTPWHAPAGRKGSRATNALGMPWRGSFGHNLRITQLYRAICNGALTVHGYLARGTSLHDPAAPTQGRAERSGRGPLRCFGSDGVGVASDPPACRSADLQPLTAPMREPRPSTCVVLGTAPAPRARAGGAVRTGQRSPGMLRCVGARRRRLPLANTRGLSSSAAPFSPVPGRLPRPLWASPRSVRCEPSTKAHTLASPWGWRTGGAAARAVCGQSRARDADFTSGTLLAVLPPLL